MNEPDCNAWFLSLPAEQQAVLRDDKWMLARAAFEAGRATAGQPTPPELFNAAIAPRPLAYPLDAYHNAPGDGPLHGTWNDKPHRIVYDLVAALMYYKR